MWHINYTYDNVREALDRYINKFCVAVLTKDRFRVGTAIDELTQSLERARFLNLVTRLIQHLFASRSPYAS